MAAAAAGEGTALGACGVAPGLASTEGVAAGLDDPPGLLDAIGLKATVVTGDEENKEAVEGAELTAGTAMSHLPQVICNQRLSTPVQQIAKELNSTMGLQTRLDHR